VGTLGREHGERSIVLPRGGLLQVLVEDQGRVNYGPRIGEAKGLIGPALLDGTELEEWSVRAVDLPSLDPFRAAAVELPAGSSGRGGVAGPSVSFGSFEADGPGDRYLRLDGWTKGNAFVNGFNLGRYWSRGPQRTLYVPGPLIRAGANELAILELQGSATREVRFVAAPDLGPDEK
jgi:beta-galactosidase